MAFASFYQKLVSLIKYLKLTNRLEERFEDATPEELTEAHECLICREGMDRGKKLPCKHVFHLDCLRMWLQHQQTCPLCRSLSFPASPLHSSRDLRAEIPIVSLPQNGAAVAAAAGAGAPGPENQNGLPVPAQAPAPGIPVPAAERPLFDIPNRDNHLLPTPAALREFDPLDYPPRYFLDELPDRIVLTTQPTAPQAIKRAVPGFFVVLTPEDQPEDLVATVEVKTDPSYSHTNQILRTLTQVFLLFSSLLFTSLHFSTVLFHLLGNHRVRLRTPHGTSPRGP
jgi:hypothetical protein